MAKRYKVVRMRLEDYNKLITNKREPIEKDLSKIMGKPAKITDVQLMRIASTATWDLGFDFEKELKKAYGGKK